MSGEKTIFYNTTDETNATNSNKGLDDAWVENIEVILIRKLGNFTDALYKIAECNDMANFSNMWALCLKQRTNLELQLANDFINRSEYDSAIGNLTTEKDDWKSKFETTDRDKTITISGLEKDKEKLTSQRQMGWGVGIVGLIIGLYLLYKYKGWFRREQQEQKEFPRDTSA